MPDKEPVVEAEPVLVAFLTTILSAGLVKLGLDATDETAGDIAVIVSGALIDLVAAWWARNRVTPVARADARETAALAKVGTVEAARSVAREEAAYADGFAVGEGDRFVVEQPHATVVQITGTLADAPIPDDKLAVLTRQMRETAERLNIDVTDVDPVAPPAPPAPDPIPWAPTRLPPPPGLD